MFENTFESLRKFTCPDWFRDAKFGIWSHWGPQSVPMAGDWYARNMYVQGSPQNLYHIRHYGHPSEFGYKDICELWKAESFDPEGLMELYYNAGARYFVAQASHHDNFFNYNSRVNPHNSINIGPKKDICELWKNAAEKYSMPFGLTEHISASFAWWKTNKYSDTYGAYKGVPYDGNDPSFRDFYHDNYEMVAGEAESMEIWHTENKKFHEYWLNAVREMIDKFTPDLLYSDGALPFGDHDAVIAGKATPLGSPLHNPGLTAVSYLYNASIAKYGENRAVYNQKDRRDEVCSIGVLDIERSQLPEILKNPWQTDTCIGGWFYDAKEKYKTPRHIIDILVDTVSKNGNLLLNIPQKPDGSLDDEEIYLLKELAAWFKINGEGIYKTRPYKTFGEGDTRVYINGFAENETKWTDSDYRFTKKGETVYAFIMKAAENRAAVIKSLADKKVKSAKLLGYGELPFVNEFGILTLKLPDILPSKYINCLAIDFI